MEVGDDVFFAELNKQISLLIMDDDDHHQSHHNHHHHDQVQYQSHPLPPLSFQDFSMGMYPNQLQMPTFLEQISVASRRESKGTGVFIPNNHHSVSNNVPRRRSNKQTGSRKSQKPYHSTNSSSKMPPRHYTTTTITPRSFDNSIY